MSLEKFWNIINSSIIGRFVDRKKQIVERTNPDRIFIENVRSFFNLPYTFAKLFCELAVREGKFGKMKALVCPNEDCGRIIHSYKYDEKIESEEIICDHCQIDEKEDYKFNTNKLKQLIYYKLIR